MELKSEFHVAAAAAVVAAVVVCIGHAIQQMFVLRRRL